MTARPAYGTDPAKYLPPHTSQLATRLSSDGVDDCLVAGILALVNGACLGEATRTPQGHEPTSAGLVRTAVRMRRMLDDPATAVGERQTGPLPASAAGRMVALTWPAYPTLRTDDIDFKTLVARQHERVVAAVEDLREILDPGRRSAGSRAVQRKPR